MNNTDIARTTVPAPSKAWVLIATDAYEAGFGKGVQAKQRGVEIENPWGDEPGREGWALGYEIGKQRTDNPQQAAPGFVMVPVVPSEAMLRPFYGCPPTELDIAYEAMLIVARNAARPLTASPTAQPSVEPVGDDLRQRCAEILEWQNTGILKGEKLREFAAKQRWADDPHVLMIAERETAREALEVLASPPPAPVLLSDAEIQAIWSAKDTPLQQSKLSAFGMDRIRAIERAVLGRVGEKTP